MNIHLLGVGGVAMGNLAALLKQLGHDVTGSDEKLYPPMSDKLVTWGIEARPFSEKNIGRADLYVIGNALSRGNPEVERVLSDGLDYVSMPQALARFVLCGKQVVVVAGTHGKTTTTFLTHHLITQASGKTAGLFAGGVRGDGHDGFCLATDSPFFVIEGDEYDSAFFDKHSKFLHYRPRYLVLTSIEFDHADIFADESDVRRTFARLLRIVPGNGLVVAAAVDAGVRRALKNYTHAPIAWYGRSAAGFSFLEDPQLFPLIGRHNRWNAEAAMTLARHLDLPETQLREALRTFPGVLRRAQTRLELPAAGEVGPVLFLEDFAHHPTAVRETIDGLRVRYPGRTLHALFEPRSATSRRNVFQEAYTQALGRADVVYLVNIHEPARIPPANRLNVRAIVRELQQSRPAHYARDPQALLLEFRRRFRRTPGKGDVVLAMSNGAFGGIYGGLEDALRQAEAAGGLRGPGRHGTAATSSKRKKAPQAVGRRSPQGRQKDPKRSS